MDKRGTKKEIIRRITAIVLKKGNKTNLLSLIRMLKLFFINETDSLKETIIIFRVECFKSIKSEFN